MTAVLVDVAEGASFEASFEDRVGLRVNDFEDEFFFLMSSYLPPYRDALFAPVPFALLSALVVVFVCGAVSVGHRRWRPAPASASIDRPRPGRAARIGFHGELTSAGVGAVVFFLGGLFFLGTEDLFYKAAYSRLRLFAYSILASYLLGSIVCLLWSVRQWTRHSRIAFLVAPLMVLVTGATVLVFMFGTRTIWRAALVTTATGRTPIPRCAGRLTGASVRVVRYDAARPACSDSPRMMMRIPTWNSSVRSHSSNTWLHSASVG